MNKNLHIFGLALLLIIISIFFPIQNAYAQKKGSKHSKESALKYSYQYSDKWRGLRFSGPTTFIERSYFSVGMSISEVWDISDILDGSTLGINSVVSFGHWIAPIHGFEVNFGIGILPYASGKLDSENTVQYSPHLTQYWSAGLTYMLHLSSYASMLEKTKRWEFIGLIGVNLKRYEKYSVEANIGLRLKHNITPGIGIYLEPSISLFNNKLNDDNPNQLSVKVTPSISVGVSIRLKEIYEYNQLQKITYIADDPKERSSSLSVKMNILYWIPFIPNIGLEYRFRRPWSIGASASVSWWKNGATHKYYQMGIYELEGRYYLGKKRRHHFGIYAQIGMYDLEFSTVGKKGEFIGGGLSYGYLLPISDRFSLDFDIGFGYTRTAYEEYQHVESGNIYEYLRTKRTHLFAPSKVGVSLVWNILFKKKGGLE